MDNTAATDTTAHEIESAFGGRWGVWLSDTGRWWGARTRPLTSEEENAGCVPFVQALNPSELTARLHEQENLHAAIAHGTNPAPHATSSINDPDATENMTLDDLRRVYGSRWDIAPITGGYRAEPRHTGGHTLIPRYGGTPAELAESIRVAEAGR